VLVIRLGNEASVVLVNVSPVRKSVRPAAGV